MFHWINFYKHMFNYWKLFVTNSKEMVGIHVFEVLTPFCCNHTPLEIKLHFTIYIYKGHTEELVWNVHVAN